ncbi:MAG TPA: zinc-ribbon domain-containing protein [Polyangiaceae bacterium]|nr:zinc-ribbon domain-containing protein [Polyangiaceae bacterium]
MNIACIACPARYAISDEKIVGRKVRIGCKRCGAKLVVDGTTEPVSVRADTGTPSAPPAERYHLALSHDQRERGDLKRIVELYGRGAISASTLAWREGMGQWLPLFEIETVAAALRSAGYSPQQAGAPSYDDDEVATRVGSGGYSADEDEATHVARSPLDDSKPPSQPGTHRFDDDDDEATSVFDSEALQARSGWSEPASWRDPARQRPLAAGEWRERGQSPLPPRSSSQPPGAWSERGLEDDEVTRMVAPLDERPERYREPMFSGPGFELRRPKSQSPAAKPSARPPSLPPDDAAKLTGQRSDDSVLFTLERLSKGKPAAAQAHERAEIDFSDLPKVSLGPAAASSALLTAPAAKLKAPPPASFVDEAPELPPKRGSKWRIFAVLMLLIGSALGVLYATGRWPLVTATAVGLWQRVQGAR